MFAKLEVPLAQALHVVFTAYASNNHCARARERVWSCRNVSDQQDILLLPPMQEI